MQKQRLDMRAQRGRGLGGMNWELRIDIYTLLCVKKTAGGELSWVLCDDPGRGHRGFVGEVQEEAGIYKYS